MRDIPFSTLAWAWPLRRPGCRALTPRPGLLATALALTTALAPAVVQARCIDEDAFDPAREAAPLAQAATGPQPLQAVQQLVRDAILRSNGIGAVRLMNEAALQDIQEAQAQKRPQAALTGAMTPSFNAGSDGDGARAQASLGVSLSQTIYDGGRSDRLVDWRRQQAEAMRLGLLSAQEQLALSTVSMAFERSRWRMQVIIYTQYVRKMGCLVEALDTIVNADRGRASELVQARKQTQQAELQLAQAQSQTRLIEAKLRRMVGDGLPSPEGMSALLLQVPELPLVLTAAEQTSEIAQLDANAAAMQQMARAIEAGTKPQVSWNLSGSALVGAGNTNGANNTNNGGSLSAGLQVSIPLLNPAINYTIQAAQKRYEAARLQRADALESRRQRIVEVHEQATASFDRLRRLGPVLKDSERLRNFTLQQWQQLGRRSLFDVMSAEGDHYNLRVQYVNALHDGEQLVAVLKSLSGGMRSWLE